MIVAVGFLLLLIYAEIKGVDVLSAFAEGVRDGLKTLRSIFPTLLFLLPVLSVVRFSGITDLLAEVLSPVTEMVGIPSEVVPLFLLRPISGSGSLALLSDILKTQGADSYVGFLASVISASTETTLYTVSVYLSGRGGERKIIFAALFLDLLTFLTAAAISPLFY